MCSINEAEKSVNRYFWKQSKDALQAPDIAQPLRTTSRDWQLVPAADLLLNKYYKEIFFLNDYVNLLQIIQS